MMHTRKDPLLRYRKYLQNAEHLTLKKLSNILYSEWKFRTNSPAIDGLHPYVLFVDLSNACNLKCPLCPTGQGSLISRDNLMALENYKKVVEPLKNYLYLVFLFNNTEPFLNRDVYEIIKFNRLSNIGSVISSNLSLKIDSKSLVDSGLEYLIVSGDGVTQEIYEQYRVNGKVQLVIDNVKKIVEEKKRMKSKRPFIEWQCLVNRKNEIELQEIETQAYHLGVDRVTFVETYFYAIQGKPGQTAAEREWLPTKEKFRTFQSEKMRIPDHAKRKPCHFLWRTAIVNSNGGVNPCCLYDTSDWGNIFDQPFSAIWNNDKYQKARRLSKANGSQPSETICDNCQAPFIWKR